MKKLILICILVQLAERSTAQGTSDRPVDTLRNEIGIDITGFVKQFLTFNSDQYVAAYVPQYFFSYRRQFGRSNLRLGLGGNFRYRPLTGFSETNPEEFFYQSYSVDLRIGYEHTTAMGRRWQLFYGADFRPSFVYVKNDAQYANGPVIYGSESHSMVWGIAPILGVRFKVTDRISIITETNFSVNFVETYEQGIHRQRTPDSPIPEQPEPEKSFDLSGGYTQPLNLIMTFDF